jgi:hypothetical protein
MKSAICIDCGAILRKATMYCSDRNACIKRTEQRNKFTGKQRDIIASLLGENDKVVRTFTFSYHQTGEKVFESATLVSRKLYEAGEDTAGGRAIDSVSVTQLAKKGILASGLVSYRYESGAMLTTHYFTLDMKALRSALIGGR